MNKPSIEGIAGMTMRNERKQNKMIIITYCIFKSSSLALLLLSDQVNWEEGNGNTSNKLIIGDTVFELYMYRIW